MAGVAVQFIVLCYLLSAAAASLPQKKTVATVQEDRERERRQRVRYTASWAVEITEGGEKMADLVARRHGYRNLGKVAHFDNVYHFALGERERATAPTDAPYTAKSSALLSERYVGFADQQYVRPVYKRSYTVPVDPRFRQQWHLLNTGQYGSEYRGRDLKVEKAWMQGLTGCNVTVGIVDDGFEYLHPDLRDNYAHTVSYDFVDGDADPVSGVDDWHGTRCAGLVSAAKDGEACGVGVAYNAKFGGLRLLSSFTDLNEASSLSYANDVIDIYSNSWGPCDEGCVDGPLRLTQLALRTGVERGRDGKGSIFVWANGNGGPEDDCAADGYSSSIYTISVGAVGVGGEQSWYDEECSAKMVTAYVTNHDGYSAVSTTAIRELCVYGFGGTSASCPMVSGAIALTLEANSNLTWRDVMYLLVLTSNTEVTTGGSYTTNGGGNRFSPKFGFGVLDTEAMVTRARHWINVPPQLEHIRFPSITSGTASRFRTVYISQQYTGSITYLEHVVVNVTLEPTGRVDPQRGHISLELRSPSRTHSTLLKFRSIDHTNRDYYRWPFMSVAFWGENPRGTWRLTIRSQSTLTNAEYSSLRFQFYGTSLVPPAVSRIPRSCHADCERGCAAAGSQFCDVCRNLRNAYTLECIDRCPSGYTVRNGYCYDRSRPEPVCNSKILSLSSGSCEKAGYSGCCTDGKCEGSITSSPFGLCHCDSICHNLDDCCKDISDINCTRKEVDATPIHYVTLRSTEGVATQYVPITDDGASSVIRIPIPFPIGTSLHSTVYVGTNGYFSFDKVFTDYTPFEFPGSSQVSLVSPFFCDVDNSKATGTIRYEVHTLGQSSDVFARVNRVISEQMGTTFAGSWLLLAEWRNVPEYGRSETITNTFQGIVVTDFTESYALFIYKCQDMQFSASAAIGFTSVDYSLFANHRLSGYSARRIGCVNSGNSEWVNLVYKLTREDLQPIQTVDLYDECELDLHYCEQECINLPNNYVCSCNDGYALQRNGIHCFPYCHAYFITEVGEFNTPSWPDYYPQSFWCKWTVNLTETLAGTDYFIVFRIDTSAYGMESNCSEEYIQFFDGLSNNATSLGKFCGTTPPAPIATSGLGANVVFVASDEHPDHLRGVRITYSISLRENECEENNGGCEHRCKDLPYSFVCECDAGYQLSANGKNCIDVDECEGSHGCDQVCTNTHGSYECSCETNFALSDDSRTCVPSCTATYISLSGSFHSPGWPLSYPQLDFTCRWTIDLGEEDYAIRFSVDPSVFGILGTHPCPREYLEFHDGLTTDAPSLGRFCYLNAPGDILTSSGQALVIFKSTNFRRPASRKGARVTYEAFRIENECLIDNGGCEQICQDTVLSFVCHCGNGYTLSADGNSCDDVDECAAGGHGCEQVCVNTHGSYTCDCEEGYGLNSDGRTCRISCGGNYTAHNGSFHTPGWPTHYPLDFRCEWYISPANPTSNTILALTVDPSSYGIHGRDPCATDYLRFHDGNTTSSRSMGTFCFLTPPSTMHTSTNQAVVVFQASTIPHRPSRVGARVTYQLFTLVNECEIDNGGCAGTCVDTMTSFECQCSTGYTLGSDGFSCEDINECALHMHHCEQVCVNVVGSYACDCEEGYGLNSDGRTCRISCGGNYTANSGSFHTPGWPTHYPLDFRCEWYISPANPTSNTILALTVDPSSYGIHGSSSCTRDYLKLYDGNSTAAQSLGVFCSLIVPDIQYASNSNAVVVFQSSSSRQNSNRPGVRITYQLFELVNECEVSNGGCEGTCVNTLTSFQCQCGEGFTLGTNGLSCEDVDECTSSHRDYCDGLCVNTNGSFHCDCRPDFRLSDNGRTCIPVCGGHIVAASGSLATPGWPDFYPSLSFSCEWVVETALNTIIDFSFGEQYGIVGNPPCTTDYIEIIDGHRESSVSLGRFCSLRVPESVCASSNIATVVFQGSHRSHSTQHIGVNVTFTQTIRVNECEVDNGGCEHLCMDQPKSFSCGCRSGYTLDSNGRNCTDIDECSQRHNCPERCVNTEGSFHCACNDPDFVVRSDDQTCVPGCGGRTTETNGTFSTPGWPEFYHSINYNCTWIIDVENQTNAALDISFNDPYGIHGRDPCRTDYVEVFDGVGEIAQSMGRSCFLTKPQVLFLTSTRAMVVFKASTARHTASRVGVSFTYTTVYLGVDECLEDNGGCDQICTNTRRSYTCSCYDGYTLDPNGKQCTDINECLSSRHGCEQVCVNTQGSYLCECNRDFALSSNGRSCSLDCGGSLSLSNGTLQSPGWPETYPELDFRCIWTLDNIPSGRSVAFVVDKSAYGIYGNSPCVRDYLEFFDAVGFSGESVGRYCGLVPPDPVVLAHEGVRIVFQGRVDSRRSEEHVGMSITYTILENECTEDNGGCEHTCTDTIFSYECGCPEGYQLAPDRHTCIDVDECAEGIDVCSQMCHNIAGLYYCSCQEEFTLAPDGKTCIPVCGKTFSFPNGTINTPGWPHFYPELDFTCEWIIEVSSEYLTNDTRSAIKFVFNDTAFGFGSHSNCNRDFMRFYSGTGPDAEAVVRVCASEAPMSFTISSSAVRIVFRGSSLPHIEGQVGAMISFFTIEQEYGAAPCSTNEVVDFAGNCEEVACGGTVYATSGVLESSNWPQSDSDSRLCQWSIVHPDPSATLSVSITDIDIPRSRSGLCFWEYVIVFDTSDGHGNIPSILTPGGRFCGATPPSNTMAATGNMVHVWFQTRSSIDRGFSLSFSSIV